MFKCDIWVSSENHMTEILEILIVRVAYVATSGLKTTTNLSVCLNSVFSNLPNSIQVYQPKSST